MSKISEENIIRILSRLDVPGNAAKIYIFLLKNGPSTGYAVSKRSGVNNAVVYRELERLKNRNLVYQLGVKPLKYEAINMDGLLKNLKKQNKTEEKLLEKKDFKKKGIIFRLLYNHEAVMSFPASSTPPITAIGIAAAANIVINPMIE